MKFVWFVGGLFFLTSSAFAEIYKWTDAKGRVHFGDKPSLTQKSETVEISNLNTMSPVTVPEGLFEDGKAASSGAGSKATLPAMSKGQVLMFSTQHCRYCAQAKDYMKRQHIAYREKDIERSTAAKKDFLRYGGRGVPFFLIGTAAGTQKLSGFSEAGFKSVYPR